jgi:hypothetical protein
MSCLTNMMPGEHTLVEVVQLVLVRLVLAGCNFQVLLLRCLVSLMSMPRKQRFCSRYERPQEGRPQGGRQAV